MTTTRTLTLALALLVVLGATARAQEREQFGGPALPRDTFNRLAVAADLPLFWVRDRNSDGLLDPDELIGVGAGKPTTPYVRGGRFTPRLIAAYRRLVELRRQAAVQEELAAGRPTLVATDLSSAPAADRALVRHLVAAARIIEELYLKQTGGFRYLRQIARADPGSRALFARNHGPWCRSANTTGDRFCSGLPSFPPQRSEAYPPDLAQDEAMCKLLGGSPNAKELLDPFTVVRRRRGQLVAVPITRAFGTRMRAAAGRLRMAAGVLARDPGEQALRRYLLAAAEGFRTNDWSAADEAWVAMSATNSKWFLRVGPDEVYFDPCQQKAGFHLALALIDQSSIEWQRKLTPLRDEMEQRLARLIGKPYKARSVRFKMPDFIQIVLNAGDSRHPLGAIIGQSLPNWGKVAREGRGRTVVMTNLYTDPDSRRIARLKATSLLSPTTMRHYSSDPQVKLLDIMLHEAAHNFGPFSDYHIGGKRPTELFGGKLASTMEELKAQTAALWYLGFLRDKGLIDDERLRETYVSGIVWAFGHIAQGMFTPSGNVRPYSQLAAIQVGYFSEQGALSFRGGKFTVHFDRLPGAVERLMQKVGRIKATGDVKAARELVDTYVKGKGSASVRQKHVAKRLLRYPKEAFQYTIKL